MPRQDSKRGLQITNASFESAWDTHIVRFGVKGINLNNPPDAIEPDEFSRMSNMTHRSDASLTSRPGQTSLSTGGTKHHSIRRLNDPGSSTWTRFHGIDTSVYIGQSGALVSKDTGYSGDPLTFVPYRDALTGQPWMFVADRTRWRKIARDGTVREIGLSAPGAAPTLTLPAADDQINTICSFSPSDNTDSANWTATDPDFPAGVPPILSDVGGSQVRMLTPPGGLEDGNWYMMGIGITADMTIIDENTIGAVTLDASDDDLINFHFTVERTDLLAEMRLYFVCDDDFEANSVPGTITTKNKDFFLKSFRANDLTGFLELQRSHQEQAEFSRAQANDQGFINYTGTAHPRDANFNDLNTIEDTQTQMLAGRDTITRFGTINYPLRRSDFARFGDDTARGWDTITGIIIMVKTNADEQMALNFLDLYLLGGGGPDATDPTVAKYDYRYTHYDTLTGAESNPSPIMDEDDFFETQRQSILIDPAAYGVSTVRQRIYRRGGTLPDDWFYVGQNDSDGGVFTDDLDDEEIALAGTLEIDNYQGVPTVNASGVTVLAQPLPALWGPLDDFLIGCGDPYRPGHIYFSKRGDPDKWPDTHHTEVCSSSEELKMGGVWGGQGFVFSSERMYLLYPNLSGDDSTITATPTQCKKGMVNRWGLAIGSGGIWFINRDGIYRTSGGPEEWVSQKIDPLFRGKAVNGYQPIDFTLDTYLRLEIHENELYFMYKDTDGAVQVLVYNILLNFWRPYTFGKAPAAIYSDEGNVTSTLLIGGNTTGKTYTHTGTSDDGTAISASLRTGWVTFGNPRQEKLLGDQIVDLDTKGIDVVLQNYLNDEEVANPSNTLTTGSGRNRAIYDNFGTTPQRARNIATDISWSTTALAPILYQLGTSTITEPEVIINRPTQWDDLGHPDESYVTGVTLDIDTNNEAIDIIFEADFGGAISTMSTQTVTSDGRHKFKFSWSAAQANKVRLRPDGDCGPIVLYKVDWIAQPEPPRIAKWDVHFENGWDSYYTGLDLYCDTGGVNKTIEVYVDGTLVKTETVNTNGRKVHHITLPWGRGHVFRFIATDSNAGLLYDYRWHTEQEPSEQANWNQNFTVAGTEGDKYLKALIFQCDTFAANKTVTVECDGVVVETLTINADGRKVVQKAFPQHLGRVFRVYPTDSNPGRLYSLQWVFDQEPLALDRWETQEITHNIPGWHYPIYAHVTIKSTADVNLAVTAYNQSGTATTTNYTLTSTAGAKIKKFVPFSAGKGIMYKYVLTSASPFWLYREETSVAVRDWNSDKTIIAKPFGNDDQDPTRIMSRAELSAERGGGTSQ